MFAVFSLCCCDGLSNHLRTKHAGADTVHETGRAKRSSGCVSPLCETNDVDPELISCIRPVRLPRSLATRTPAVSSHRKNGVMNPQVHSLCRRDSSTSEAASSPLQLTWRHFACLCTFSKANKALRHAHLFGIKESNFKWWTCRSHYCTCSIRHLDFDRHFHHWLRNRFQLSL